MDFYEVLEKVIELLQRHGRVTYRALKLQFKVDDETLEALKDELLFAHPVVDEAGRGLIWSGDSAALEPESSLETDAKVRFHAILPVLTDLLQREGRVTYRTLKQIFVLDEKLLEDLRKELALRRLAIDEDGEVLAWTGETQRTAPVAVPASRDQDTPDIAAVKSPALPTPPPVTEPAVASTGPLGPPETISAEVPMDKPSVATEPSRSTPEAERRQLTVMFCDLADSTKLSQQLDPEDLREVVRAYQETAAEVIHQYEGYMAQYLGDGLLLYFGWPQAHEDDAQRALHAGLGIVEAIAHSLNPRLQRERGVQLTVRLGVHTGPVVVGQMGGGGRHENLATGETVNIAARLEGLAAPNTVMISDVTARLVGDAFTLDDLGPHELKGVAEPMQLFRVLGPTEDHQDDGTAVAGPFLVGRDEEAGLLMRRWEQIKEGLGQVVLVCGEAGIGKSSLVSLARRHVAHEGGIRITFRCSPYHQSSAFYPVIAHLEQMLDFDGDEDDNDKLDKLGQLLRMTGFTANEAVPLLATLLSLPLGDRYPRLTQSPQQQRQQTLDTLVEWLFEEAGRQPVLAVWEDLHWADPSTLELLGSVLEQTPTVQMLHVLTYRPEFDPPWPMRSHMTPITLNRLERPQVEALITHLAGGKMIPDDIVQHIVGKTDGVPLYVEELTKMLLQSELIREEQNTYVLTGQLATTAIPDTLQASLMARLDQLHSAKEVAQLGAVVGREFSYDLMRMLTALDEPTLQARLRQLVEAELLYQRGRPPRAAYRFKHALLQDAAYASLLRSTRQQFHQQIAQTLIEQFPILVETQPEILAHHYTEAECYEQAVDAWQCAGQRGMTRSAHGEALACFEQALQALEHAPASHEMSERAIDLRFNLRNVFQTLGDSNRMLSTLREAEALAETLHDNRRLAWVFRHLTNYFSQTGDYERAVEAGQRALKLASSFADKALNIAIPMALAPLYIDLGKYQQVLDTMAPIITSLAGEPLDAHFGLAHNASVISRVFLVRCSAELGLFERGRPEGEESIRIAQTVEHLFSLQPACMELGVLHLQQGAVQTAIPLLERALSAALDLQNDAYWLWAASCLGLTYILAGHSTQALPLLKRASVQLDAPIHVHYRTRAMAALSEGYLLAGRLDEAEALTHSALEFARAHNLRGHLAQALRLSAQIILQRVPPDSDQAETHYQQAITLADELGMRPLQAHCHRGLGTLYSRIGQPEHARAELSTAIELYRDMEMTFWLPETEAALTEVGGKV